MTGELAFRRPGETPEQMCRVNQNMANPPSRVMFCGRCGHATSNTSQGHYWAWCRVNPDEKAFHRCCPGSCELVDGEDMDPTAACHPAPGTYQEWARAADAAEPSWFKISDIPPEGIVLPDGPVRLSLGVPLNYDGSAVIKVSRQATPPSDSKESES